MMVASKTEDYQLLGDVLDQGLSELGDSREDVNVELFASDKQHVLDLYCSKRKNCCYQFYWPSCGMAYGNPRFSELGKVLTKVALERSRMVLCSPDWAALKVLPWVVVGAGGLGAGKTSGAGTRGVSLDVVIGGRTGHSDTNGGESSDNRSKIHADCGPAENPSL